MWAITSYYNPVRYKRRLANYKIFRAKLQAPLATVELSFDGRFELTDDDADILIQISGGAVLWQKERLLNVAIKSVPPDVDKIAWIDCDVILTRPDWVEEAKRQLNEFNVVQLFSTATNLNSEDRETNFDSYRAYPSVPGVVSFFNETGRIQLDKQPSGIYRLGLAWAAKRTILHDHGLYDAAIVGGGPRSLVNAMYGQFEDLIRIQNLNVAYREHYLKWAHPFHASVAKRVSYVSGHLYHLWHGDAKNRGHIGRHDRLASFNFNPDLDIAIGDNGAWHWARPRPELDKFLANFFIDRAEDG
jgi:hypothetical protein